MSGSGYYYVFYIEEAGDSTPRRGGDSAAGGRRGPWRRSVAVALRKVEFEGARAGGLSTSVPKVR